MTGSASERPIDAAAYARSERRLARLLGTERDVLLLQGEAILLLEAAARGLGGPGIRILNLVSGPYGSVIGDWLAAGGAVCETLEVPYDRALDPEAVAVALRRADYDVVSVVHAEAATGVVNPLGEIAAAAHATGTVVLVDAVASVGAETLPIDDWGLDLVMVGPQKAPGGPAGVCALVAGERGWAQIARNPSAPRDSILSLLDWKERWIDAGRTRLYGYAYEHEMRALERMLDALEDDPGLERLIERHGRARDATRDGVRALGLAPWVERDDEAAAVVTLVRPPEGIATAALVEAASRELDGALPGLLAVAPGTLADAAVRVNHTGEAARPATVLAALTALGGALQSLGREPDVAAALQAAEHRLTADR